MTVIDKQFVPPALPLPPEQYSASYHNELNKILRLYFNLLNLHLDDVINVLNIAGPFDTVYTETLQANTVNTDTLNALRAVISHGLVKNLLADNVQGGNAVFNNLTVSQSNASLFTGSGREINFPHIAASDSGDQYATADDTPTIVTWDTLAESAGFTLNVNNTATATYSGVYKIDFSLQFANTANAAHDVYVWLQVNGSDVADSMTSFTLPARKSAGVPSYVCAYSSITFDIQAGQSIGLWWATDKAYVVSPATDGVYMEHIPVQTSPYNRPAAPSAIGSIVYVSAPFPPRTRVTPIGVLGSGSVGSVSFFIT
jgi:hypothetical protein